jgi:hypothetical protein
MCELQAGPPRSAHDVMPEEQLNLFSAVNIPVEQPSPQCLAPRPVVVDLDDEALIVAIPAANLGGCRALAAEAAPTTGSRHPGSRSALPTFCRFWY